MTLLQKDHPFLLIFRWYEKGETTLLFFPQWDGSDFRSRAPCCRHNSRHYSNWTSLLFPVMQVRALMTVVVATASPSQRCVTSCRTVPCPSSSSHPMAETSPAPTATASCSTPVSSHPCSRTCSASWVRCLSHVGFCCFCSCFSCCPRFGWRMWGVWGLTACGTCSSVIVGDGGLPNAEAVGWVPEPQRMHYKRFIHFHDSFCTFCWWIGHFMLCVYLLASWGEHSGHCFHTCPCWISGILMGIAIRSGSPLSLSIAEPVWKQLAGMPLSISDLTEMDKDFVPGQPLSFFLRPSGVGHLGLSKHLS